LLKLYEPQLQLLTLARDGWQQQLFRPRKFLPRDSFSRRRSSGCGGDGTHVFRTDAAAAGAEAVAACARLISVLAQQANAAAAGAHLLLLLLLLTLAQQVWRDSSRCKVSKNVFIPEVPMQRIFYTIAS